MEARLETYFWLVDRLQLEDDPKNKVNMAKGTVKVSTALQNRITNGMYIARLLREMTNTYQSRSGNQVSLDPALSQIKDNDKAFKPQNWQLIFNQLEQFNIFIEPKKQEAIVKNLRLDLALEVVDVLFDIDNSPSGE